MLGAYAYILVYASSPDAMHVVKLAELACGASSRCPWCTEQLD